MTTSDLKTNIYLKKFLPQQQMVNNFQNLVQKFTEDFYKRVFSLSGVFQGGILTSTVNDTIDISLPLGGTNSLGRDIELDPSDANQIAFENAAAVDYYIGLNSIESPSGIETNVKTGKLKYTFFEERIGERADPDLVVDDADGTMTIRVDSVFEAGVDHSGRTVKVFLKDTELGGAIGPLSLITPFEELPVQYDGTNNFIETATGLGQSAIDISTDPNDYEVVAIGPTIRRNTDLRTIPTILFLGIVTGNGPAAQPSVFDQTDRRVLSSLTPSSGTGFFAQFLTLLEGGGTIGHDITTTGLLSWSSDLKIRPLGSTGAVTIAASSITLADDEVAYAVLPDPFVTSTVTMQKATRGAAILMNPSSYWIFHRHGILAQVRGGLQLEKGEQRQLEDVVIGNSIYFSDNDKLRYSEVDNIFHFDADGGTDNAELAIGTKIYFGDPANNDKLETDPVSGAWALLNNNNVEDTSLVLGRYLSQRASGSDFAFDTNVTGDPWPRYRLLADGTISWGSGAVAPDTDLFREGVGILATTNILKSILGQLTLDDIALTRDSATVLAISSNLQITGKELFAGPAANNDVLRFVEGATPIWEILTNNVQRWQVDENGDAKSARDTLTQSGTAYNKASDASVIAGVNASLNEVYDQTKPRDLLRVTPNNAPDAAINIATALLTAQTTEKFGIVNQSNVSGYTGGTANFATGVQTGGGAGFTPFNATASFYFKYGLILLADDTILVILPSGEAASAATAPEPIMTGGVNIAVITIQDDGTGGIGNINNIIESNILRFSAAGAPSIPTKDKFDIVALSGAGGLTNATTTYPVPNILTDADILGLSGLQKTGTDKWEPVDLVGLAFIEKSAGIWYLRGDIDDLVPSAANPVRIIFN